MRKDFETQLVIAIKSCPIVYIPHFHYGFVDEEISVVLSRSRTGLPPNLKVIEFDAARNMIIDFESKEKHPNADDRSFDFFNAWVLGDDEDEKIIVLKNFSHLIQKKSQGEKKYISYLQVFAEKYERGDYDKEKTILIVSPEPPTDLAEGLENIITTITIDAPNDDEIYEEIKKENFVESLSEQKKELIRKDLCRTLLGLQYYEIKQIIRSTLAQDKDVLTEMSAATALKEKKQIVRKSGIIEVVDTNISFKDIGGLDVLKKDLEQKATIYQNLREATDHGLPLPKGVLILGMPGCGKSMIAKAIANEFNVSLLRLDIGRLMGKYVGQSEGNLRKALEVAEAAHPCILWIDEIEKAFAGTDGNNKDMLATRLMGYFLTWMQERKSAVYIVATANDVMKPEFMRKGRFDDVYFVDFPNKIERKDIFEQKLKPFIDSRKSIIDIKLSDSDIQEITEEKLSGFSGAEIECVVSTVMEKSFVNYVKSSDIATNRTKQTADKKVFIEVIDKIGDSITSKQKSDKPENRTNIEKIRDFQKIYKFTPATTPEK